jgi:hypothetical protein
MPNITTPPQTILTHLLSTLVRPLRPTQQQILILWCSLWLALPGRINFLNLSRYSGRSEKTFRNWFDKPLCWTSLNATLFQQLQEAGQLGPSAILAIDASFIAKSGKTTPGLGKFWNGSVGCAERGLELSCCTLIDLEHRQAIVLHAQQTPGPLEPGMSRLQVYADHASDVLGSLPPAVLDTLSAVVGDAYYAKKPFVDAMHARGMTVVSKLGCDADLHYLYTGPRSGKAGRPKRWDGKVDFVDYSRWESLDLPSGASAAYGAKLYSPSLKQILSVVVLLYPRPKAGTPRRCVLFGTDANMTAKQVIACYRARFELEFPFRDAKQFTGLLTCQSRQPGALEFHWNMAFLTVNLEWARQLQSHEGPTETFVFRMEDGKRRAYNQFLARRIFEVLPHTATWEKYQACLSDVLNLGLKAA